MAILFRCKGCDAKIKVANGTDGRKVKCPRCHLKQLVPHDHDVTDDRPDAASHQPASDSGQQRPAASPGRDAPRSASQDTDRPSLSVDDTADPLAAPPPGDVSDADDPLAALANAADEDEPDDGGIDLFDEPADTRSDDRADAHEPPDDADLAEPPAAAAPTVPRPTPKPAPVEQRSASASPQDDVADKHTIEDDEPASGSHASAQRSSAGTRGPRAIPLSGASMRSSAGGSQAPARPMPRPGPAAAPPAAEPAFDESTAPPRPAPPRPRIKAPAYSSLVMIGWILRVLAFLSVGVATRDTMDALNGAGDLAMISKAILGTITAVRGLVYAILIWAAGEAILAIRDMARNSYR